MWLLPPGAQGNPGSAARLCEQTNSTLITRQRDDALQFYQLSSYYSADFESAGVRKRKEQARDAAIVGQ